MNFKIYILVFGFIFSFPILAKKSKLIVLFGQSRPPFVDETTSSGISVELMNEALNDLNVTYEKRFMATKRMEAELKSGEADIAVELQKTNKLFYYSQEFISYRNFAVSYDQKSYPTWVSMAGQKVCAWQNAKKDLGPDFENEVKNFKGYSEFPNQRKQVLSWLSRDCQIIIIDDTLLWEHIRQIKKMNSPIPIFNKSELTFTPIPYAHELWWYVAFKNNTYRELFDKSLKKMKDDGRYQKIREKYN